MMSGEKIYVFDFDYTVTHIHTDGIAKVKDEVTSDYILNNIKDGFVETIRHLAENGIRIYIATYGDDSFADGLEDATAGHALISRYMEVIFGADQTFFNAPKRNEAGEIVSYRNVIAKESKDDKKYHLEIIAEREGLCVTNPDDMNKIVFFDDDKNNVAYFAGQGCMTLDPISAENAANIAKNDQLFITSFNEFISGVTPQIQAEAVPEAL